MERRLLFLSLLLLIFSFASCSGGGSSGGGNPPPSSSSSTSSSGSSSGGGSSWGTVLPLGAFQLLQPANGSQGLGAVITFSWEAASGASSYRLEFSQRQDFSALAYAVLIDHGQTSQYRMDDVPARLIPGSSYYWRVVAQNEGGETPASNAPFSFTLKPKPSNFRLLSPVQEQVTIPTPTFSWENAQEATGYVLELLRDPGTGFQTFVTISLTGGITSFTLPATMPLTMDEIYSWRVRAVNEMGSTSGTAPVGYSPGIVEDPVFAVTLGGLLEQVVVSDPDTGDDRPLDSCTDGQYLYIAGYDSPSPGDTEWRIEKRRLSDLQLDSTFGSNGVVTVNFPGADRARAITVDSGYLYVAGEDYTPGDSQWRIQKYNKSTGAFVTETTRYYTVRDPSSGFRNIPHALFLEAGTLYVGGAARATWGAIIVSFDLDLIEQQSSDLYYPPREILSLGNFLFLHTMSDVLPEDSTFSRITKLRKTGLSLDQSFASGGTLYTADDPGAITLYSTTIFLITRDDLSTNTWTYRTVDATSGSVVQLSKYNPRALRAGLGEASLPQDLIYVSGDLYNVGGVFSSASPTNQFWVISKKNAGDLSTPKDFGVYGWIITDPSPGDDLAVRIHAVGNDLYVVGYTQVGQNDWAIRIEKRRK